MLALLVASLFACQDAQSQDPRPQDPKPKPAQTQPDAKKPAASKPRFVEPWDDKTAKLKVKAFGKLLKRKGSMGVRNRALDELAGGRNKLLIKPLKRMIETDKSVVLKKRAVDLIAAQPPDQANSVIRKLLKNRRVTSNAQVHAGLIRALSQCGYTSRQWREIDDILESDYDTECVCVHEAILDLVRVHKEQQALKMLLRNLDEPIPSNVDARSNPPAAYWKARWHSWAIWKGKVKQALFAVTGQNFSTASEAKVWLRKNKLPKPSSGKDAAKRGRGKTRAR